MLILTGSLIWPPRQRWSSLSWPVFQVQSGVRRRLLKDVRTSGRNECREEEWRRDVQCLMQSYSKPLGTGALGWLCLAGAPRTNGDQPHICLECSASYLLITCRADTLRANEVAKYPMSWRNAATNFKGSRSAAWELSAPEKGANFSGIMNKQRAKRRIQAAKMGVRNCPA